MSVKRAAITLILFSLVGLIGIGPSSAADDFALDVTLGNFRICLSFGGTDYCRSSPSSIKAPQPNVGGTVELGCGASVLGCIYAKPKTQTKPSARPSDPKNEKAEVPKQAEVKEPAFQYTQDAPGISAKQGLFEAMNTHLERQRQFGATRRSEAERVARVAALNAEHNAVIAQTSDLKSRVDNIVFQVSLYVKQVHLLSEIKQSESIRDLKQELSKLGEISKAKGTAKTDGSSGVRLGGMPLSTEASDVLRRILTRAKLDAAIVTSVNRTPRKQAEVIFQYIQKNGLASAYQLYGPAGDQVIHAYESNSQEPRGVILQRMGDEAETQIASLEELGDARTELMHVSSSNFAFDVAPSSVADQKAFEDAVEVELKENPNLVRFLKPPLDKDAFHLEIKKEPALIERR